MASLLFALAGCTVECHSSTSRSTSSSSGGEQPASHDHHNHGHETSQPQNGRGDAVRVVSTGDKQGSGGSDSQDQGGPSEGDNQRDGHRVVRPSGPAPDNASGSDGSGGSDASSAGGRTAGGDTVRTTPSTDAGGSETSGSSSSGDSGAAGTPQAGEEPAAGKKPRTPGNKRENEPHVARPTKRRAVMKGEGREGDGSVSKGEKHE